MSGGRFDPESIYFEPTRSWSFNPASKELGAPWGLTIHAKIGARWRRLLLMPDDGESFGALCDRVIQWYADEPETFASELFEGADRARSGESERVAG